METQHLDKNQKVKLKKYLSEATAALAVMDDERLHIKDIAEAVHQELGIEKKIFNKTAKLIHKNKFMDEEGTLDACKDLYEQVSTIHESGL